MFKWLSLEAWQLRDVLDQRDFEIALLRKENNLLKEENEYLKEQNRHLDNINKFRQIEINKANRHIKEIEEEYALIPKAKRTKTPDEVARQNM